MTFENRRRFASNRVIALSFVLTLATSAVIAQEFRNESYVDETQPGIDLIYRMEYDQAIQFFAELEARYPEHPGPPLTRAVIMWLRELLSRRELDLDHFLSAGYFKDAAMHDMPEADRQAYFSALDKARERAERRLSDHPGDKDARYYLGGVEGALGSFALTIERSYMKALRHGKKAYEFQKAIIEEDADFDDSYMTVGTYEYILGTLPWYVKWIASIAGLHGSEERGFAYLIRAAEKGLFVRSEARVLLMVLYVREEEYPYALEMARQLHRRYPENYILHLNQAQILERMGGQGEAVKTYMAVVRAAEEGRPGYSKLPLGTFRYTLGTRIWSLGYPGEALEIFQSSSLDPNTPPRERVLSHLRAGEILDVMGRQTNAASHYREVQLLDNFDDSHSRAAEYLKREPNQ